MAQPKNVTLSFDLDKESADVTFKKLEKKPGVKELKKIESKDKTTIKYQTSFQDAIENKSFIDDIKSDENINTSQMKVNCNFAPCIISTDINLAKQQAANVKFSYVDNKIANQVKFHKEVDKYRIDAKEMEGYFEMIEADKILSSSKTNKLDSKQVSDYGDIEQWFLNQTNVLKKEIQKQLTKYDKQYELMSVNLLFNWQHALKFMKTDNFQKSLIMFHGTKTRRLGSIFENGFVLGVMHL